MQVDSEERCAARRVLGGKRRGVECTLNTLGAPHVVDWTWRATAPAAVTKPGPAGISSTRASTPQRSKTPAQAQPQPQPRPPHSQQPPPTQQRERHQMQPPKSGQRRPGARDDQLRGPRAVTGDSSKVSKASPSKASPTCPCLLDRSPTCRPLCQRLSYCWPDSGDLACSDLPVVWEALVPRLFQAVLAHDLTCWACSGRK